MEYKKYIDKFDSQEDIQIALDNGELFKPYVAQVSGGVMDYNEEDVTPYETRPLTLKIISGGTLFWSSYSATSKTIYYSKDFGNTWTSWTSMDMNDSGNTGMSVSAGEIIQFKGDNDTYSDAPTSSTVSHRYNTGFFNSTALFDVYGNIMSLIDSENFAELDAFPENTHHNLQGLFAIVQASGGVRDASNLILPVNELTHSCYAFMFYYNRHLSKAPQLPAETLDLKSYYGMFMGCQELQTAPELPATTLTESCYNSMFINCSNLNYIKCLATDATAQSATRNWLSGVSATGTFVKDASMDSWGRGVNGIPENWTVIDADI